MNKQEEIINNMITIVKVPDSHIIVMHKDFTPHVWNGEEMLRLDQQIKKV